jgi:hypothetical protein
VFETLASPGFRGSRVRGSPKANQAFSRLFSAIPVGALTTGRSKRRPKLDYPASGA